MIILAFLALCLILLPVVGCGETSGECGDEATWSLDSNGLLTISGTGDVTGAPWRNTGIIGNVKSVVVESGVTSLCDDAFYGCANLTSVTIPADLDLLYTGSGIFRFCPSLENFFVSGEDGYCFSVDGVLYCKEFTNDYYATLYAYPAGKKAEDFVIPNGATAIEPFEVMVIEEFSFENCVNLKSVTLPEGNEYYPISVKWAAFCGCTGLTEITIPEYTDSLDEGAFANCANLIKVTFESTDVWIDSSAFDYRSEDLTFYAYEGSSALTFAQNHDINYVTLSASTIVKDSGECGENASWTLYKDGNLVISGTGAMTKTPWDEEDIKSVVVESGITSICGSAFECYENLTSVTIEGSTTSIGDDAFESCYALTSVIFEGSTNTIGTCAFQYCNTLTSVTLPSELQYLEISTFYGCSSLTSLALPPSVRQIGANVFSDCSSNLTLEVKEGSFAHYYAQKEKIKFTTSSYTPKTVDSGTCGESLSWTLDDLGLLTISGTGPMTDYNYNQSSPWGKHIVRVQIEQGVTSIGTGAFTECGSLISVSIPASVARIGGQAFMSCYELPAITIPNGVTRIEDSAFCSCENLAAITVPGSVIDIDSAAFHSCGSLTSVTIENGVVFISDDAFLSCSNLKDVSIPGSVVSIGGYAFSYCASLTSVVVPEGVNVIAYNAFSHCRNLVSVTLPYSAKVLGTSIFSECSQNLNLTVVDGSVAQQYAIDNQIGCTVAGTGPNIVESGTCGTGVSWTVDDTGLLTIYGSGSMDSNNASTWTRDIREAVIEQGVRGVYTAAFSDCALTSVTLPPSAEVYTRSYDGVFSECASLQNIYVSRANEKLCDVDGVLFSKDKTTLIAYPRGRSDTEYAIPNGTVSIKECAFQNCAAITKVSIPNSVTGIGNRAFMDCVGLADVHIPNSVTGLGEFTFYGCASLTEVQIPNSVTRIGYSTFNRCTGLISVSLPDSMDTIAPCLFYGCSSLPEIFIPDSVTMIGFSAFEGCSRLGSVSVPDSVERIGEEAFKDCTSLTTVTLGSGVTEIGQMAFYGCQSLTEIELPDSLDSIGANAFCYCKAMSKVSLPQNITAIGNYVFYGCDELTEAVIAAGTENIGDYAFASCGKLAMVSVPATVTSISGNAFDNCSDGLTLAVTVNSDALRYAQNHRINYVIAAAGGETVASGSCGDSVNWSLDQDGVLTISGSGQMADYSRSAPAPYYERGQSIQYIVIENGVTGIGKYAFYNLSNLVSVSLPNSLLTIASNAFDSCRSLPDITIPSSVTSVSGNSFGYCSKMSSVHVAENHPAYCSEDGVLFNKQKTTLVLFPAGKAKSSSYQVPDSVVRLEEYAFYTNTLTEIILPDSLREIPPYAIYYCTGIKSITIPEGVEELGSCSLAGCQRMTRAELPESLTKIGEYAFSVCSALTDIVIPDGVTSIGNFAFNFCSSLPTINIPQGVEYIGQAAFMGCAQLNSIVIPSSVSALYARTFDRCANLTEIRIPGTVTRIDADVFQGCSDSLTIYGYTGTKAEEFAQQNTITFISLDIEAQNPDWNLPRSLTVIGEEAFAGVPASVIKLYNGVTAIGSKAFAGCPNLTQIFIPATVTSIAEDAFAGVKNLVIFGAYRSEAEFFANVHENMTFMPVQ